jgi:hypothetical protein
MLKDADRIRPTGASRNRAGGLLLIALAQASAAGAQAHSSGEVVVPKIGVRECPAQETSGEIVVCGKGTGRSPYRLAPAPEGFDPHGDMDSVSRERHRLFEVGASGIGSCSTSGPGGWTGCDLIKWKDQYEQRARSKPQEHGVFLKVGPAKYRVGD